MASSPLVPRNAEHSPPNAFLPPRSTAACSSSATVLLHSPRDSRPRHHLLVNPTHIFLSLSL
ncbi:hypothetical protein MUK42_11261 [Musa troglodytarum]|uniref:Uncharacterized protein n=1 Tax=Musa troglodytarum TaxID=320322 RepID=A0A9E7GG37_9LILI|nr:hypothetical protein MUK42_11261 [Musa troglodytarum]